MTASARQQAHDVVAWLLEHGVHDVVLCPGSRSAPLAYALHAADADGLVRLHVRVDEREAGFLALGLAKGSGRVVPVVTTSGTAVANLHPAVLEALHAGVPVLALTADRPARLRGTGANQTTVQPGIFPGVPPIGTSDGEGGGAVLGDPPTDGPSHLNLELDEPLVDDVVPVAAPATRPAAPRRHAHVVDAADVVHLPQGPRTVVLAGDDAGPAARRVAQVGAWPLLAEPTSGARTGPALPTYRLLLAHEPLVRDVERVVLLGHATLSRPVTRLLARPDVDVVHVGTRATFPVPAGDRVTFAAAVEAEPGEPSPWLESWHDADARAGAAVTAVLAERPGSGLDVARDVAAAVPPGGLLVVGASQPIRDLDLVAPAWPVGERRLVLANRGLAGIDGVVSTAVGAALGRPSTRAVVLVGDLTFLHGSNGLLVGPDEPRPDLTVVVANDDGGAIFATLEQGDPARATSFERVFATPTGADLGALCAGYGVPHRRVRPADLPAALATPSPGIEVVEVTLRRDDRRALDAALRAVL